jgi:endonuclease/exonuclease/phosphatase family metal-dependent hydrolase
MNDETKSVEFSLLTFNCFGAPFWTPRRRLRTLAQELDRLAPDVVCLQEVQSHAMRRLLTENCSIYNDYAFVSSKRAPRGSLLSLARAPLDLTDFDLYEAQGAWYAPTLMDRFTQKGALVSRLAYAGRQIVVINTHLVANYGANWQPESRPARDQQRQLHQLAAIVRTLPLDAILLVAGDFNLPRSSWLYDEFLELSGMRDPLAGDTRPTYRPFPGVPAHYALPIDFVFVRLPADLHAYIESDLCLTEKTLLVGGGQSYLSDHMGVRVTLRWQPEPE